MSPLVSSPEDSRALDTLRARGDALVARALGWCAIQSGSRNLDGLRRQHAALREAFAVLPGAIDSLPLADLEEIAADGTAVRTPCADALRLTVRPDAPRQVLLTGHYDTVYPEGCGFEAVAVRADGALSGPGIADMKGGLSVMLGALEALETHPLAARLGYVVLLSPDEETGSIASGPHLAEAAARAEIGMTYEPCMPDGALAGARKGSGNFHATLQGRAAHAGRDFASGRNALAGGAALAAALHALNGEREGVTLNIARLDGGGALNVVPDRAVLRFNVRTPDAQGAAWCLGRIEEALAHARLSDLTVALHGGFTRPPKPLNRAQERLLHEVGRVGAMIGQSVTWRSSGGVCEGNNLFAAGLPNVDTLGVRGGDIHSHDEYAWPPSFTERAALSAALLMKIAADEIDTAAIRRSMGSDA